MFGFGLAWVRIARGGFGVLVPYICCFGAPSLPSALAPSYIFLPLVASFALVVSFLLVWPLAVLVLVSAGLFVAGEFFSGCFWVPSTVEVPVLQARGICCLTFW